MRIHHYIKNLLVFLPLVFSGYLSDTQLLGNTVIGFAAFSLMASAVYIINDICDLENDRRHSTKRLRPLPSGTVSLRQAQVLVAVLIMLSLFFSQLVWERQWSALGLLAGYLFINLGYSLGLKAIPLLDVTVLVLGYLFRVLYGSAITGIEISHWLYLTVLSLSFYLAFGKRRNELAKETGESRLVLRHYNFSFLDKNMYLCLALTIVFYALWSIDPLTAARLQGAKVFWTVPLVMLIAMRYSLLIEGDSDGDPVEVLYHDKALLIMLGGYALITLGLIYL